METSKNTSGQKKTSPRAELLNKVRAEVYAHPKFEALLKRAVDFSDERIDKILEEPPLLSPCPALKGYAFYHLQEYKSKESATSENIAWYLVKRDTERLPSFVVQGSETYKKSLDRFFQENRNLFEDNIPRLLFFKSEKNILAAYVDSYGHYSVREFSSTYQWISPIVVIVPKRKKDKS